MVRRTITMPESLDTLVRAHAREGESFSATIVRLIEAGSYGEGRRKPPSYVGSFDGPGDLGIRAEEYLREIDSFES